MKKPLIIISAILLLILGYIFLPNLIRSGTGMINPEKTEPQKFPKVLFITTGIDEGAGQISVGVTTAIETFNKRGIFVWLENRNILLQPSELSKYSIMILPTSSGYNDGDRKYSLTFLSDYEMRNIKDWVRKGGILIAEQNIGRNKPEGADRVGAAGELNSGNWELSELFGFNMREIDMKGFSIEETGLMGFNVWNGTVKEKITEDEWALVPAEIISDKTKTLAEWNNGSENYPAIIVNEYGKGKAYLITSTYILHPSNSGGASSIDQIKNFYNYILANGGEILNTKFELNPWPDACNTAFCLSFISKGSDEQLSKLVRFLKTESLPSVFFIDSSMSSDRLKILEEDKNISLQSNFFSEENLGSADYSAVVQKLLMNEQEFGKNFKGLKFPFNKTNFWGLIYADEKGYTFESSIGANHLSGYEGSVFPYNVTVSQKSFYKTLNLLEISRIGSNDETYFGRSFSEIDYFDEDQKTDAQLFNKYLFDFYKYSVKSNNGMMVYDGSPQFTAFSENTMQPLKNLIDTLRKENCWITSLEEITDFRNKLKVLAVEISDSDNEVKFIINLPPDIEIKGLTFKLKSKPSNIEFSGKSKLTEINGEFYLICDVKNADIVTLNF